MIRSSIVFIVVGLFLAALAYDQVSPAEVSTGDTVVEPVVSPSVTDPARLNGAWFCPMGTSSPGGLADHKIEISNLSTEPAVANVGILTDEGKGPTLRVPLDPLWTEEIVLSTIAQADATGAVVEIIGGTGVVGHTLTTPFGPAEGPCATHVSSSWYFASGRTTRDSLEFIALMNPFPEDVVYNIELFRSAGRPRRPAELQGGVVPASSVQIINIDEHVQREEAVAASITTVRGRLVAERLQTADGVLGPLGSALQLGVTQPAQSWMLPAGRIHEAGDDRVIVFNPSADEVASVEVELWPVNPTDRSLYGLGAIPRELLPGRFEIIDLRVEAERFGLRLPYEVGVSVRSTNGVPIVTERWQFATEAVGSLVIDGGRSETTEAPAAGEAPAEGEAPVDGASGEGTTAEGDQAVNPEGEEPSEEGAGPEGELDVPGILGGEAQELVQPTATVGIATSRGTEVSSNRWVIPWVSTSNTNSTAVIVTSVTEAAIEVYTLVNGALTGPIRAAIAPGGRVIVPLSVAAAGTAVLVESDVPISVEAQVVQVGLGMSVVPGVPTVDQ